MIFHTFTDNFPSQYACTNLVFYILPVLCTPFFFCLLLISANLRIIQLQQLSERLKYSISLNNVYSTAVVVLTNLPMVIFAQNMVLYCLFYSEHYWHIYISLSVIVNNKYIFSVHNRCKTEVNFRLMSNVFTIESTGIVLNLL